MNITKGKIAKAQKVVIYGVEGIGKSSLAAKFPEPLFIDTEGSTSNMDVARMDKPSSYTMLMNQIAFIKANPTVCKTLIIDTIDWAERLATEYVCAAGNKSDITKFGYGEGFIQLEQEMGRLLNALSDLIETGINVVLTAHAIIKKFEQPDEMGAYDRYELKLGNKTTNKTAALVKEWADMVLFCNYKTHVYATDDKGTKHKAQGGERVIYAEHHPAWDAKNRHGLPFEFPLDYSHISHIFVNQSLQPASSSVAEVKTEVPRVEQSAVVTEKTQEKVSFIAEMDRIGTLFSGFPQSLKDLMTVQGLGNEDIQRAMVAFGHFPANMPLENVPPEYWENIVANWSAVLNVLGGN